MENDVAARTRALWDRLNEASGKYGGVELCAVTKTVSAERINPVYDAGVRIIGENRVQELMDKLPGLRSDFKIHVIGRLQTNKVKYIADKADMIQSLDRMALAEEISKRCVQRPILHYGGGASAGSEDRRTYDRGPGGGRPGGREAVFPADADVV